MRKLFLFLILAALSLSVAAAIAWKTRENILAHFLSRQLHVPVTIRSLEISKQSADVSHLWIGNFPKSRSTTSFTCENLTLQASTDQIFGNLVTIESIDLDKIFVGIEFYDAQGTDSNWKRMLEEKGEKKKSSKDYLIKTLHLRNLTVEVTQADGTVKRYPTIKEMEFHNISSETGFPVERIEKAIFDLMMKDLFKKLQLDQLFKSLSPVPIPFIN
jgi:hypothetical protein